VDLSEFDLAFGETYVVSVQAKGDGVYFADSPVATARVSYAIKAEISDFTNADVSRREGEGSIVSKTADGLVYGANDGAWVLFAIRMQMSEIGKEDLLVIDFGEVSKNTRLAGRFYASDTGSSYTYNLGGDAPISSNVTRAYSMEKATIADGAFYLGLGMGGDTGARQICVKSIRVVALELLGD
jgi:hypothetical protein